jgi:hypothetical protein
VTADKAGALFTNGSIHITYMMFRADTLTRPPVQRTEAFSILPIFTDRESRTIFTFKQWEGGERFNELWFDWIEIGISTSECRRGRYIGTSQMQFRNQWQSSYMKQPAMTTRTRTGQEEEDQVDTWDITMDEAKIQIPNISGELEQAQAQMDAKGTTDGEIVVESLNGPIITAVEGAWEGAFAGAFEGAVEGDMELVGTGTLLGTDELKGTVSEPERAITLNGVEANIEERKGRAAWTMKPRFSRIEDMAGAGDGNGIGTCNRTQRANTGTMVWAMLFKAPDYVNADLIGGVEDGFMDIGEVHGDRWLLDSSRCVAGQSMNIKARKVHLARREKMWLLLMVGRRLREEVDTGEQDFVHCAVGVSQECENY